MKGVVRSLVALALLGLSGPSQAAKISPEPAATLLLPYFEVDLDSPYTLNTSFSINNASALSIIAHVTIWSDLSVPIMNFDVALTGYDVEQIDLRNLLVNGVLPPTFSSNPSCAGILPLPVLPASFRTHLQALLTGNASPIVGKCAGRNLGGNIARGYITVDTVNSCNFLFPSDAGYFPALATDDNVLWGDYFYLDASQHTASGNTLVHIPAENPAPAPGEYTFYGRYVGWTAVDKRRPLATNFAARYRIGGPISRSDLIVWRDSKVIQGFFNCPAIPGRPAWYPLGQEGLAVFDEEECLDMPGVDPFPAETQRVEVNGADFPIPFNFGWVNLNLNTPGGGPPADPDAAQAWVVVSMESSGLFTVGYDAIQIDNASNPIHGIPSL